MNRNNLKGSAILLTAALLWGIAFTAQSGAATRIPSFLCNSLRSFIATVFLFLFLSFKKMRGGTGPIPETATGRKKLFGCGALCGLFLTVAVNFQQFGIMVYPQGVASEARAGFLTALYVLFVPIFSVFVGKRADWKLWCAVVVALVGFYFLCLSGGISGIYLGDLLVLASAVAFAFHILSVDRFGSEIDGVRLSMVQFAVVGVLSGVLFFIFEEVQWADLLAALPQILYLGIVSSGIAYTLQIVGQKYAEPTVASISMSMESVFAALGGWVIMNNALTPREILGCLLVFAAIVLAQLPKRLNVKKSLKMN